MFITHIKISSHLLRLIDCCNNSLNAERHIFVVLITTIEKSNSLVARLAPVVEKSLHQHWVFKLNVVHMTVGLVQTTSSLYYAAVTCEIKLFLNYLSLCKRASEIILFQHVETGLQL